MTAKLSPDLGVIWSPEHVQVAVYSLVTNGSGTKVAVRLLGTEAAIAPSEELRAAIQADMKKRGLHPA